MENEVAVVGLDLAKQVFQVHGADGEGKKLFNRKLRRDEVQDFFATLGPCTVAMEAGSASHFWARKIGALGHRTIILPGQYVKPFVKRDKSDALDAQAIAVAAIQDGMPSVPIKSAEQQALTVVIKTRALFIRQRTKAFHALRGHLAEFGVITGTGTAKLGSLAADVRNGLISGVPLTVQNTISAIYEEIEMLDAKITKFEKDIATLSQQDDDVARLMTIPGVGPVTASTIKAYVPNPAVFKSSRHFASWLGLTPRHQGSGGKVRAGRISKRGNPTLRSLLFLAGAVVVRQIMKDRGTDPWLAKLVERRPFKVAAIAAANKIARVIWAILTSNASYRLPQRG